MSLRDSVSRQLCHRVADVQTQLPNNSEVGRYDSLEKSVPASSQKNYLT